MAEEWEVEPDRKHWIDEASGYDCLIVRNPHGKNLCGYVGVPLGHPWHGEYHQTIDAEVHGGLTYSDLCDDAPDARICHSVERDGEIACDHVWWLGFDCAHVWDLVPGMDDALRRIGRLTPRLSWLPEREVVYRNLAYVENECRGLAAQAFAARYPADG